MQNETIQTTTSSLAVNTAAQVHSRSSWLLESLVPNSTHTNPDYSEASSTEIRQTQITVNSAISIFNQLLGSFSYVSFSFNADESQQAIQVHLCRTQQKLNEISIHVVKNAEHKGARYSSIEQRIFGDVTDNNKAIVSNSLLNYDSASAQEFLALAGRCKDAQMKYLSSDIIFHNNPQGIQEWINQPAGGIADTGGQNKYVQAFAKQLGKTPVVGQSAVPQIIINRAGPSQHDLLISQAIPKYDGRTDIRQGLHFFPDDNVLLAFIADSNPNYFQIKEETHPHWEKASNSQFLNGFETVHVKGNELARFGIEEGTYFMTNRGPMYELAQNFSQLLEYLQMNNATEQRQFIFCNHYADAAYFGEFVRQLNISIKFKNFFFLHSLGTFKAEGLGFPDKLKGDVAAAAALEQSLRFGDRILSELWIAQNGHHDFIANSHAIATDAQRHLKIDTPPVMIAVDENAVGRVNRSERRDLSLKAFNRLHSMYINTCNNLELGAPVPENQRLTLEQLIESQIILEMSRHAEAETKGKGVTVKSIAIAQSDSRATTPQAPNRVLVMNINLGARYNEHDKPFQNEIELIIKDIASIRKNGGHVIIQDSFDYEFGLELRKICDCYISVPAFEPFGMGVLEAAAAGAAIIARSEVPAVQEVLATNVITVKFPLRSDNAKIGITDAAMLVGGKPNCNLEPSDKIQKILQGTAAAVNAVTLGTSPTTNTMSFSPTTMGQNATEKFLNSPYSWQKVAERFLRKIYHT